MVSKVTLINTTMLINITTILTIINMSAKVSYHLSEMDARSRERIVKIGIITGLSHAKRRH